MLSACCQEGSVAVTHGAPRNRPSALQRLRPGTVVEIPKLLTKKARPPRRAALTRGPDGAADDSVNFARGWPH